MAGNVQVEAERPELADPPPRPYRALEPQRFGYPVHVGRAPAPAAGNTGERLSAQVPIPPIR